MKKATKEQIRRYLELKEDIENKKAELEELKDVIVSTADEYGTPDGDNVNRRTFTIGKDCTVVVTTVISPYFDVKTFKTEHPKLHAEYYTGEKVSERIKATIDG